MAEFKPKTSSETSQTRASGLDESEDLLDSEGFMAQPTSVVRNKVPEKQTPTAQLVAVLEEAAQKVMSSLEDQLKSAQGEAEQMKAEIKNKEMEAVKMAGEIETLKNEIERSRADLAASKTRYRETIAKLKEQLEKTKTTAGATIEKYKTELEACKKRLDNIQIGAKNGALVNQLLVKELEKWRQEAKEAVNANSDAYKALMDIIPRLAPKSEKQRFIVPEHELTSPATPDTTSQEKARRDQNYSATRIEEIVPVVMTDLAGYNALTDCQPRISRVINRQSDVNDEIIRKIPPLKIAKGSNKKSKWLKHPVTLQKSFQDEEMPLISCLRKRNNINYSDGPSKTKSVKRKRGRYLRSSANKTEVVSLDEASEQNKPIELSTTDIEKLDTAESNTNPIIEEPHDEDSCDALVLCRMQRRICLDEVPAGKAAVRVRQGHMVFELCGTFLCSHCHSNNKRCFQKTTKCVYCCSHQNCNESGSTPEATSMSPKMIENY
ncbi:hypothetical protein Ddc_14087 [Ditylenchus destructor]|nr:hypothetical protein Ddc_14087 [Ditylenchus destructor]